MEAGEVTEPDRILTAAEAELANTRRLIAGHLAVCDARRSSEATALVGWCDTCRSLAVHRGRCEDQVRLLASEEAETEALF